ncbi:MAG: hypothetical protein AAGD05_08350 [Bacteroidota bacterium]
MSIDLTLIILQALFLSLYGTTGMVEAVGKKKERWSIVLVPFLTIAFVSVSLGGIVKGKSQPILLFLLVLDYGIRFRSSDAIPLLKTFVSATIFFLAFVTFYFWWGTPLLWGVVLLVFAIIAGLSNKWPKALIRRMAYFQKSAVVITLFFLMEPSIVSVQQNLKPVATVPITSIINEQNFLLLAVLAIFLLIGFFWNEKSRP